MMPTLAIRYKKEYLLPHAITHGKFLITDTAGKAVARFRSTAPYTLKRNAPYFFITFALAMANDSGLDCAECSPREASGFFASPPHGLADTEILADFSASSSIL